MSGGFSAHQTYKLQTYTVLQGSTRPGWYLSSSSPETTAKHQISRQHDISTQKPISVLFFPSDYYWLEPTVMRAAPETTSWRLPSVSALFTDSSIDILSRDTPAVTGWCPLLDIYQRTEEEPKHVCVNEGNTKHRKGPHRTTKNGLRPPERPQRTAQDSKDLWKDRKRPHRTTQDKTFR